MATQSVDFTVIPQEDLYLSKGSKSLKRVSKGDLYPCQMQKTQNFNCLFRHYAKHNGLDKETLTFTFLEELQGDQLPDMVHLLTGDEIFVSHRKIKSDEPVLDTTSALIRSLDAARNDNIFWDVKFIFVNEANAELGANKCIICNRSAYFCGMFRNSSMLESVQNEVEISDHKLHIFSAMLEFLYTSKVSNLSAFDLEECTDLLLLSNEYVIDDLKHVCQLAISELISPLNVSKMFCFAEDIGADLLRRNIKRYVEQNIGLLRDNESFRKELEEVPKLALFVVDSMSDLSGHPSVKRRRISSSPVVAVGTIDHDSDGPTTIHPAMSDATATAADMEDMIPIGDDVGSTGNVVL